MRNLYRFEGFAKDFEALEKWSFTALCMVSAALPGAS